MDAGTEGKRTTTAWDATKTEEKKRENRHIKKNDGAGLHFLFIIIFFF